MTLKEWLEEEARRGDLLKRQGRIMAHKEARLPRRGTQEWLAARLGVDQGLVSKWVRRVTTPERYGTKIVRLSKGKVTLAELMRVAPSPAAVLGGGRKP
jgi:DNA-binding transcriptional regulator YdaS (Cro superfamily)